MSLVVAIDPGTHSMGIALYKYGTLKELITLKANPSLQRSQRQEEIIRALNKLDDSKGYSLTGGMVICEEPLLQGKANNSVQRLLGALESYFSPTPINYIHPMTVKKAMGSGSLDKLEVALALGNLLKTEDEQNLIADAVAREAWDETDAAAIGFTYLMKGVNNDN